MEVGISVGTESQKDLGRNHWRSSTQSPAQCRSSRAGGPGLCPSGFWISLSTKTPKPLWATWVFGHSPVKNGNSCIFIYVCCFFCHWVSLRWFFCVLLLHPIRYLNILIWKDRKTEILLPGATNSFFWPWDTTWTVSTALTGPKLKPCMPSKGSFILLIYHFKSKLLKRLCKRVLWIQRWLQFTKTSQWKVTLVSDCNLIFNRRLRCN